MNSVEDVLLKDICNITMGQSPKSDNYKYEPEGLPFMQGCTTFGSFYPIIDTWTSDWNKEAAEEDILFTVRAPVGDVNFAPCRMAIGRGLAALHPTTVSKEYLFYLLKYTKKLFLSKSNGAVYESINSDTLSNVKLKIHSKNDDRERIASILSNYDQLIENNNRRIKILEDMAESLYKEWFVRFRFPGYEKIKFIDSIPEFFSIKKIDDICDLYRGKGYSSDDISSGDMTLLSMNNIRPFGGFIRDFSRQYCGKYQDYHVLQDGDLIMCITDMTQERRVIGYVGLVTAGDKKMIACTHLVKLVTKGINNIFLYSMFTYSNLSKEISMRATGTNVLGLTTDIIKKVKTLIPPQPLIDLFVKKVQPIFDLIKKLQLENENLTKQRDALLPRLMSGKLEVAGGAN